MPSLPHAPHLTRLALTIGVDIPGFHSFPAQDVLVELAADARVQDLVDEVAKHFGVPPGADQVLLKPLLRYPGAPEGLGFGYLPNNAALADCALHDGIELVLCDRVLRPATTVQIDVSRADDDLYLVDLRGPNRGRVTRLPSGESVAVGSAPSSDLKVLVDDREVPAHAVTLTNLGGDFVACDVVDATSLYLIGEPAQKTGYRLLPGATVSFRREGTDYASLAITTEPGMQGRSPVGRIQFDMAARLAEPGYAPLPENVAQLPVQPELPEPQPLPWEQIVIPLAIGSAVFGFSHSVMALVITPITAVIPLMVHRRQQRAVYRRYRLARSAWVRKIKQIDEDLSRLAGAEAENLVAENPPTEVWAIRAYRRLAGLWGHGIDHPRFLRIPLGYVDQPSRYQVKVADGVDARDPDYQTYIEKAGRVCTDSAITPQLSQVPATIDLREHHLGIVGPLQLVDGVATNVLLQLACTHSPGEVSVAALLPASETVRERYDWLKWLPQARAGSMLLPAQRIIAGREACHAFLVEMRAIHAELHDHRDSGVKSSYAALVVHEAAEVDASLLREVCELADGLVRIVWLGTSRDTTPQIITSLVEVTTIADNGGGDVAVGVLRSGDPGLTGLRIDVDVFSAVPSSIVRALAPLYDPRASGANAGIPLSVPLLATTPIDRPAANEKPRELLGKHLPVPLGIGEDGLFELDLVTDGPHALIGGTTGAGKSELLQTLTCGLATRYSPAEVSLFLVDFKGGATFAPFRDLPHVVGYVSDLDQLNVNRALAFLRAELRRRSVAFEQMDNAKEYSDYLEQALASGATAILPRLVVVFDEFATMVQEFEKSTMAAVVDIAQRGRSWGVHLVLATQQPTRDVVVPKVRANVTARVALRTLSGDDSLTIIDQPDAVRIPRALPGRALVRLEGSLLTEFQTSFSGAPHKDLVSRRPVAITDFKIASEVAQKRAARSGGRRGTQLEYCVTRIQSAAIARSPGALPMPPRLEDQPHRPLFGSAAAPLELGVGGEGSGLTLRLGLRDLPSQQTQDVVETDLTRGVLCFVGPNGSGRTSALVVAAEQFAVASTDRVAGIVALDSGSRLGALIEERFEQASVVSMAQLDDVTRVIDQLSAILQARRNPGLAGERPLAYQETNPILLLVDGFDVVGRAFSGSALTPWAAKLVELLTAGRRYDIYAAIAAGGIRDIDSAIAASQDLTVQLHAHYEGTAVAPEDRLPGFGLDGLGHLVQLYAPSEMPRPQHVLDAALHRFLAPSGWRERTQTATPSTPTIGMFSLGCDEVTRQQFEVDLTDSHTLVIGGSRSGRTSLLIDMARQLAESLGRKVAFLSPRGDVDEQHLELVTAAQLCDLYQLDRAGRVAFFDDMQVCRLKDGRFVLVVDDSFAVGSPDNSAIVNSVLSQLRSESCVQLIASSTAQLVGNSELTSGMKSGGITVYLRPKAGISDFDDGYRVRSMYFRHRPGMAYDSRDAIVHTEEGQAVIHLSTEIRGL